MWQGTILIHWCWLAPPIDLYFTLGGLAENQNGAHSLIPSSLIGHTTCVYYIISIGIHIGRPTPFYQIPTRQANTYFIYLPQRNGSVSWPELFMQGGLCIRPLCVAVRCFCWLLLWWLIIMQYLQNEGEDRAQIRFLPRCRHGHAGQSESASFTFSSCYITVYNAHA